jgi:hypothetical protein
MQRVRLIGGAETFDGDDLALNGGRNRCHAGADLDAVEARGRLVFISGMTARRPDGSIAGIGDIEAQTRQVCENLKAAIEAAGGTLDDICRLDVYVRDIGLLEPPQSSAGILSQPRSGLHHGGSHASRRA